MTSKTVSISSEPSRDIPAREGWTMLVSLGFATTVAIWIVGYLSFIGPGRAIGELLFAMMLLLVLIGGVLAGRYRTGGVADLRKGMLAGGWTGMIVAIFNLLIVGSLVRSNTLGEVLGWLLGLFLVSILLGAVGGMIGGIKRGASRLRRTSPLSVFSTVLACTVFMLLFSGGLVTGLEAGLAVPDWPNSFGHNMLLYPLRNWEGGIFFEHAHRLYGMLVGVGVVTFLVLVFLNDRRRWMRICSILLLLMVIIQGLMGGFRVTEISILLAIIHGVFGQLVFVSVVMMASFTTMFWRSSTVRTPHESTENDRFLTALLPLALVLQLILGACLRHLQVMSPDGESLLLPQWAMYTHITFGVIAFALAILVGLRAWGAYPDQRLVHRLGQAVMIVVSLQFVLGIIALVYVLIRSGVMPPPMEVIFTSMHQATGAILLALSALLFIWHRRLVEPMPSRSSSTH